MRPNPKPKKIKLSPEEYTVLRRLVYYEQHGICKGCGLWFPFNQFSLHHKDRAIGDVRENVEGYCVPCHPDW